MSINNFSSIQISVFNSAIDAAIKKAKLFIGDLTQSDKQVVIEELRKLKLIPQRRDKCQNCGKPVKPESTYTNPYLTQLHGFVYCSQLCANVHFDQYCATPSNPGNKQCDCMMQLESCNGKDCTNKISIP